jgi:hypothetical protein
MVPIGTKAALRSSYDDQEAQLLLLGAHSPSRVRSAISVNPLEPRSNKANCSMGSGYRPVRYRICPQVGDQVSDTCRLHCRMNGFRSAGHR